MTEPQQIIPIPELREKFQFELAGEAALLLAVLLTAGLLAFGLQGNAALQAGVPLLVLAVGGITISRLARVSVCKLRHAETPDGSTLVIRPASLTIPATVLLTHNALAEPVNSTTLELPWSAVEAWVVRPARSGYRRRYPAHHEITFHAADTPGHIYVSREDLGPRADGQLLAAVMQHCAAALDVRDDTVALPGDARGTAQRDR